MYQCTLPTPARVPPVPMAQMNPSTFPSVCFHISGPTEGQDSYTTLKARIPTYTMLCVNLSTMSSTTNHHQFGKK